MMSTMPSAAASYDSNLETVLTLPKQTAAMAVADACRETALAFLEDSARWGKAELAMWLMGPYAQLTRYISPDSRRGSGSHARPVILLRDIDARMVERVIQTAREEIVAALRALCEPQGAEEFAVRMLTSGYVARCEDEGRVAGWVPTTNARRLADRVLSLFGADYLARADEYDSAFAVCASCQCVEFEASSRLRGSCGRHGSGVFGMWGRQSMQPELPEGA